MRVVVDTSVWSLALRRNTPSEAMPLVNLLRNLITDDLVALLGSVRQEVLSRTNPLPQILTLARNFTLNLYRAQMFENMAQAQRLCSFGLDTLQQLFRMK